MDDSIGNPLESTGTPLAPGTRRFLMNAGRTTKQGQQVSSGKFLDDYKATVTTMHMHPERHERHRRAERQHGPGPVAVG